MEYLKHDSDFETERLDNLQREGRIGKFRLSRQFLLEVSWSMLQKTMANFFVIHAEQWWVPYDGVEYMAYSPLFRVIDKGEQIPYYSLEWDENYNLTMVSRRD
jgi:hypothetical protein